MLFVAFISHGQIGNTGSPSRIVRDNNNVDPFANEKDSLDILDSEVPDAETPHPLGLLPNPVIRKDTRYTYEELIWRTIDTSLLRFHEYNLVDKWKYPHLFLGNVGQNYKSLVYDADRKAGYQTGFNAFQKYWHTPQNSRYYNTKIPFSSIYYNLGPSIENNAHVVHSQNIGPHYNFAVDYRLTNAHGPFNNQKTLLHNLNMNNWFNSKNHRYTLFFAFLFNRSQLEENGGLAIDNFYTKENKGADKELVSVNLDVANNDIKNKGIYLKQIFFLGQKDSVQTNDTTYIDLVQRKHAISYSFHYDKWSYRYYDEQEALTSTDNYYDGFYYDSTATADSTRFWTINQSFRWENTPETWKGDSSKVLSKIRYFAAMDYGYTKFLNLTIGEKWHNLSFSGGLASNPLIERKLQYGANGKIYVSPKSAGDYNINAFLFWKINDMMNLKAVVESTKSSATQKEITYRSNHYKWDNNLDAVFNNKMSLIFRCDHGDIDGELTWVNTQKHIYYDEDFELQQAPNNINVLVFRASKAFDWKNFYLYNGITAQYISDREKVNLPVFFLKQSFHYKGGFIKRKLTAHLGLDITYHTNYFADAYNPSSTDFYRQNSEKLKFYPIMDAYFEIFIKRARIFFLLSHLNQGMFKQKGYYVAPDYGAQDRAFKVGVSWQFYD